MVAIWFRLGHVRFGFIKHRRHNIALKYSSCLPISILTGLCNIDIVDISGVLASSTTGSSDFYDEDHELLAILSTISLVVLHAQHHSQHTPNSAQWGIQYVFRSWLIQQLAISLLNDDNLFNNGRFFLLIRPSLLPLLHRLKNSVGTFCLALVLSRTMLCVGRGPTGDMQRCVDRL